MKKPPDGVSEGRKNFYAEPEFRRLRRRLETRRLRLVCFAQILRLGGIASRDSEGGLVVPSLSVGTTYEMEKAGLRLGQRWIHAGAKAAAPKISGNATVRATIADFILPYP
jgi:hypothetical protein